MKSTNFPESRTIRVAVSESTELIPSPYYVPASNEPATESQARSAARRAGYALRKSRRRISLDNFGRFMIIDPETNFCVLGTRYELDPEDVIEFFKD